MCLIVGSKVAVNFYVEVFKRSPSTSVGALLHTAPLLLLPPSVIHTSIEAHGLPINITLPLGIKSSTHQHSDNSFPPYTDTSRYCIPPPHSLTSTASKPQPRTFFTGEDEEEGHCVSEFPDSLNNDIEHTFVVDMSRMQYGEAGRRLLRENYFLDTFNQFCNSMKKVCEELRLARIYPHLPGFLGIENEQRLKA